MHPIKKAVIPAAGFATRVLPITKALPKEMLPIVDKPAIAYLVEECYQNGIKDILVISSARSYVTENYFDINSELEEKLISIGRQDIIDSCLRIPDDCHIYFHRQKRALGLGHAVLCAKEFVGDEPFMVLYGDDVITGNATSELLKAYEKYNCSVCGMKYIDHREDMKKYSSLAVEEISYNIYRVTDMIEKPQNDRDILSQFSIQGRVLLTPDIFDILENTKEGLGGEIQLTDAIAVLARDSSKNLVGVEYTGDKYDIGDKFDIIRANIAFGLKHPDVSDKLERYLKSLFGI